jgi:hypothetical protein
MKIENHFFATARDGNIQKFNAYPHYSSGKYVTRFYVENYIPGKNNWSGKMCTFKNQEDAIAFGYKIASATPKANDFPSIKKLVEINAAYKKSFE